MTRLRAIVLTGGVLSGYLVAFGGGVAWDRHVQARVLQQAQDIIDSRSQAEDSADDGYSDDREDGDDSGMDDDEADDGSGACDMPADDAEEISV